MRFFGLIGLAIAVCLAAACPASAAEYRLDSQDKVRIKVVDWQAGEKQLYEWVELTGDYSIGPDGALSLPLIGDVPARGKTSSELAAAISGMVKARTNLLTQPSTSVEVVQYRPLYVLGDVDKPGEYGYRPGMTVLQAVSVAGGFYRLPDAISMRLNRDSVTAQGDLDNARLDMRRMFARKARFEAERAGSATIAMPDSLKNSPDAVQLIAAEASIMKARSEQLAAQLAALDRLHDLYTKEMASLDEKRVSEQKELDNASRELSNITGLVSQGLTVSARQFALQTSVSDIQASVVDTQTQRVRTEQEMSKAEREGIDLRQGRATEIEAGLRDTDAAIELDASKVSTARGLVEDAIATGRSDITAQNASAPNYTIMRLVDGQMSTTPVDEGATVQPGDVIRVTIPLAVPDGGAGNPSPQRRVPTETQ